MLWIDTYAANQNKKIVKKKKGAPKFGEIIKKDKANIWIVVLLLAKRVTFTRLCPSLSAKNCLKEEIVISLKIMIKDGMISKRSLEYEIK